MAVYIKNPVFVNSQVLGKALADAFGITKPITGLTIEVDCTKTLPCVTISFCPTLDDQEELVQVARAYSLVERESYLKMTEAEKKSWRERDPLL